MPAKAVRIPSYRRHKPTGQAVVTIAGRDIDLGKHGSAASRQEYNRLITEFAAGGGSLPAASDLTVVESLAAFMCQSGTIIATELANRPARPRRSPRWWIA